MMRRSDMREGRIERRRKRLLSGFVSGWALEVSNARELMRAKWASRTYLYRDRVWSGRSTNIAIGASCANRMKRTSARSSLVEPASQFTHRFHITHVAMAERIRRIIAPVTRGLNATIAEGLAIEGEQFVRMVPTDDTRETPDAWIVRRTPSYQGR
jgi:hypothetical protein